MSDSPVSPPHDDDLQFDRAEFTATSVEAGVACSACRQDIVDAYYQINGQIFCAACRRKVYETFFAGSPWPRVSKAACFGVVAGLIGMGIYYGVAAVAGRELGLIAIVVGLLVGGAVRKGSNSRGGWFYQLMAITLTYAAVAGSYSIFAVKAWREYKAQHAVTQSAPADQTVSASDDGPRNIPTAIYVISMALVCLALPVAIGIQNPMTLLIVGFALYEAWKINRRPALNIIGPCQVAGGRPITPPVWRPE